MKRRGLLLLLVPLTGCYPAYRRHVWAEHTCATGPVIKLTVRGDLTRLSQKDRDYLTQAAESMERLSQ